MIFGPLKRGFSNFSGKRRDPTSYIFFFSGDPIIILAFFGLSKWRRSSCAKFLMRKNFVNQSEFIILKELSDKISFKGIDWLSMWLKPCFFLWAQLLYFSLLEKDAHSLYHLFRWYDIGMRVEWQIRHFLSFFFYGQWVQRVAIVHWVSLIHYQPQLLRGALVHEQKLHHRVCSVRIRPLRCSHYGSVSIMGFFHPPNPTLQSINFMV